MTRTSTLAPPLSAQDTRSVRLAIDAVRALAMDAVQAANSGHPGTPMALAPVGYVLWTRHLRHNPRNPSWPGRDRFVLSCGHASMLQYALLHLTGYDLTLDDIRAFRQWGSRSPGHPEYGHAPAVETEIFIDNRSATRHTVVEVITQDRRDLLFWLSAALHREEITIDLAKINTEGSRVADVFYVTDEGGTKVTESARIEELKNRILASIEEMEREVNAS